MGTDDVIKLLATTNRSAVAKATGLPYMWLSNLVWGNIASPGSHRIDVLRDHFERQIPQKGTGE